MPLSDLDLNSRGGGLSSASRLSSRELAKICRTHERPSQVESLVQVQEGKALMLALWRSRSPDLACRPGGVLHCLNAEGVDAAHCLIPPSAIREMQWLSAKSSPPSMPRTFRSASSNRQDASRDKNPRNIVRGRQTLPGIECESLSKHSVVPESCGPPAYRSRQPAGIGADLKRRPVSTATVEHELEAL